MSKPDLILNEQKGFAGLIANVMEPLNRNPKFKEAFKDTERKILINASNLNYAALLIIENGTLVVKSISNKPKSNLKKKAIGWDGYISMDTQIFLKLAMKRLPIIKLGLMIITGKVKIRGIFKLLVMLKLIKILTE
ncbi:MAG: hypothetical protein ACFE85_11545 [Candidatus Hodarchaeota archaeon]